MRKSAKIRIFIAILMIGWWHSFVGGCAAIRELSPPSESSLTGDLSKLGGWFESGQGLMLDTQESEVLDAVQREYDVFTRELIAVEGEATAFVTLPQESFRLQLRFYSSEDSSIVEYRSRAGLYSGTLIQKNGVLTQITESGETEELHQTLPQELSEILYTSLFQLYQLPSESLLFDLSEGIRIYLSEPISLPQGYEVILEGYMLEKNSSSAGQFSTKDEELDQQIRSKVVYLPKKITLQHPAERIRISWVHQRLNGTH
jgi:hypothetical protein